jgi:hypothetical protein
MSRTILINGVIAGLVSIFGILGTMMADTHSLWLGYLVMLVALSSILVGVKQYRDHELGGTIRFGRAFLIGLGIAVVASFVYTVIWEAYLALTHYRFMNEYFDSILAAKRAAGVTGANYQKAVAEVDAMRQQYADPLYRLPMTFIELFPVGLLIALVSAVLLRNPRFLPARHDPGAA